MMMDKFFCDFGTANLFLAQIALVMRFRGDDGIKTSGPGNQNYFFLAIFFEKFFFFFIISDGHISVVF